MLILCQHFFQVELENAKTKFKMDANVSAPLRICKQFDAFNVTYIIKTNETRPSIPNAFDEIMRNASQLSVPEKTSEKNNFDKLRNELVSYMDENSIGWSKSIVETTGKRFVDNLASILWHITCHHDYFRKRFLDIPLVFNRYQNYDNYIEKRKPKPQLSSEKLSTLVGTLSGFLIQPWFSKKQYRDFRKNVSDLVDSAQKMSVYLKNTNEQMKKDHSLPHPTHKLDENTEITIKASCAKVHASYVEVDEKLSGLHMWAKLFFFVPCPLRYACGSFRA